MIFFNISVRYAGKPSSAKNSENEIIKQSLKIKGVRDIALNFKLTAFILTMRDGWLL